MKKITFIIGLISLFILNGCADPQNQNINNDNEAPTIIQNYDSRSNPPRFIRLEFPKNLGEISYMEDFCGYGENQEEGPNSFIIYGNCYTYGYKDPNITKGDNFKPWFTITSINIEDKGHSSIPKTDFLLTEYKDHAFYIKYYYDVGENEDFWNNEFFHKEFPSILKNLQFVEYSSSEELKRIPATPEGGEWIYVKPKLLLSPEFYL